MEVVFATDGLSPHKIGGIQRHSRLLVESLVEQDEALRLVVVHPHYGEKVFEHEQIIEVPVRGFFGEKHFLLEYYDYSKRVLDVVLGYPGRLIYSQGLSIWSGMRRVADRLIVNPHGLEPFQSITWKDWLRSLAVRRAEKALFKHCRVVVSLGGRLTEILAQQCGVPPAKIRVLPNAVRPTDGLAAKEFREPHLVLFVGRFSENKGIPYLLAAARELNSDGYRNRFQLELCGSGPLFEALEPKYRSDNIRFRGRIDDDQLAEAYERASLLVLPTLFEGMPTVVLEAMSYGTPVFVTDVGATRELIDETNGAIIAKASASSIKAELIRFFDAKRDYRQALGRRSREKVLERFTWSKVAKKHLDLFHELTHCD